ncbi:radical SAM protein [Pseudanabaena sp. BC1403]|uniref:radical SAM protein n=1 Tax=Pseudanabaena sp. BC1403 TaxID=2043171 RepID=UPI000CD89986|nr:radical SAM protein [Pseudanabaena sp. BC1403]
MQDIKNFKYDPTQRMEIIRSIYLGLLEREPDDSGLFHWLKSWIDGDSLSHIAKCIVNSNEYKSLKSISGKSKEGDIVQKSEIIRGLYLGILKREPDADGLSQWMDTWTSWDDLEYISVCILSSDEYKCLSKSFYSRANTKTEDNSVYQKFPLIYKPENMPFLSQRGQARPLMLMIETINICNNDCIICPYSAQSRQKSTMPMHLFEKVVDDYIEMGGGAISLTPLVGEVLLDKLLLQRIDFVKSKKAITSLSVTTNALMAKNYTDYDLEILIRSFDQINISIYGLDREEYKLMTRRDMYDQVIDSIERILKFSQNNISFGFRHLKNRSKEDVQQWIDNLVSNTGKNVTIHSSTSTYSNWSYFDTSISLPFDASWSKVNVNKSQCLIPILSCQVMSNGDVSFCACANFNATGELMIGNIMENSLTEMYNSEKVRKLWDWETYGIPSFCQMCSFHTSVDSVGTVPWIFRDPVRYIGG